MLIANMRRRHPRLTEKELLIVEMVIDNYKNIQIAQKLGINIKTIEGHLTKIYRKLGVKSRYQMIDQKIFWLKFFRENPQIPLVFLVSIYKFKHFLGKLN